MPGFAPFSSRLLPVPALLLPSSSLASQCCHPPPPSPPPQSCPKEGPRAGRRWRRLVGRRFSGGGELQEGVREDGAKAAMATSGSPLEGHEVGGGVAVLPRVAAATTQPWQDRLALLICHPVDIRIRVEVLAPATPIEILLCPMWIRSQTEEDRNGRIIRRLVKVLPNCKCINCSGVMKLVKENDLLTIKDSSHPSFGLYARLLLFGQPEERNRTTVVRDALRLVDIVTY